GERAPGGGGDPRHPPAPGASEGGAAFGIRVMRALACAAVLAAGIWAAGGGAAAAQAPIRPPSIILILADDLGYGDLGTYAQQLIPTPNLDRMAAEGMQFTQHYSGAPVCAPSRSVLMTGRHGGRTTIRGNFGANGERVPLLETDVTVAKVLRDAGYATGLVGKWGLGEPGTSGVPQAQGFDHFFGFL